MRSSSCAQEQSNKHKKRNNNSNNNNPEQKEQNKEQEQEQEHQSSKSTTQLFGVPSEGLFISCFPLPPPGVWAPEARLAAAAAQEEGAPGHPISSADFQLHQLGLPRAYGLNMVKL